MIFEENNAIEIPHYDNVFIYFLIKNNKVVYVGQTKNGLKRPLSHTNKDYDTIKIIYYKEEELNIKEDLFIKKYQPIYNRTLNGCNSYSLIKVRNEIRKITNKNNLTIRKIKNVIKLLDIKIIEIGTKKYINIEDFDKILNYVERN